MVQQYHYYMLEYTSYEPIKALNQEKLFFRFIEIKMFENTKKIWENLIRIY